MIKPVNIFRMICLGTPSMRWLFFLVFIPLFLIHENSVSQCPTAFTTTEITTSVKLDDFNDLIGGITVNAVILNITAGAGSIWDLSVTAAPIVAVDLYPSLPAFQGAPLTLAAINARAFNTCETPNQEYPLGFPSVPPRISGTLAASFAAGSPNFIVGTGGADLAQFKNVGACVLPPTQINGTGSPAATPSTHTFRLDIQVLPGVGPPVVTPGLYRLDLSFFVEEDGIAGACLPVLTYSLNIDIQPILQLKMSSPSQIDFTFDDIKKYNAGIVKFGATILEVSSSLNWDLMAVGTSAAYELLAADFIWDNPVRYSTPICAAANYRIPLEALELRQTPANPTGGANYSAAFTNPTYFPPAGLAPTGANNIEVARFPYTLAGDYSTGGDKTIAGNWDFGLGGTSRPPGSFQIPPNSAMAAGFRYVIDYRLVPGLPVTFGGFMADYACPGVYLMEVKYILAEDQ